MRVRQRLNRLERQAALSSKASDAYRDRWSDEDWLAQIEQEGQQGAFADEPDFPVALATYRQAIERATAQTDPPFEPPAGFMPNLDRHLRVLNWRNLSRFPDVHEGWNWLAEMLERVAHNKPAVTETEFRELETWFQAHQDDLYCEKGSEILDLGNGRKITTTNMRYELSKGPRALGVTEVVEDLRLLKESYNCRAFHELTPKTLAIRAAERP